MGNQQAGGRLRRCGIRRRKTGGIEGDMLGELLAPILDQKRILVIYAGPDTPPILEDIQDVRTFKSPKTAAHRAAQIIMRMRTLPVGSMDYEGAERRLLAIRRAAISVRQDSKSGRWVPLVNVRGCDDATMAAVLTDAGYTTRRTRLGPGWFTVWR